MFWLALLSADCLAGACVGASKSANPLSPAIAGPIAGVGITAPTVVAPAIDALVNTNDAADHAAGRERGDQRRPAADLQLRDRHRPRLHQSRSSRRTSVPQDASGRDQPDPAAALAPERKYYWHARAEDGANTGPFGATSAFSVFTPVVFGTPVLLAPINDATDEHVPAAAGDRQRLAQRPG